MKKTSIAMCAVLFGALFISNAFANTGDVAAEVTTTSVEANTTTGAEETKATETTEATTGAAAEATTGAAAEATTGDVTTGAVAEATTGDVTTGAVATGAVEATTGAVATGAAEATTGESEKSINDTLHAILDKYFEDNASKFNTAKDRKDFFETVKANINKAAETAKEAQKEAFEIIKGALETYELK
jgi:hypothetical protein